MTQGSWRCPVALQRRSYISNGHSPESCSGEWMPSKRRSSAVAFPTFGKSVSFLTLARSTLCGLMTGSDAAEKPVSMDPVAVFRMRAFSCQMAPFAACVFTMPDFDAFSKFCSLNAGANRRERPNQNSCCVSDESFNLAVIARYRLSGIASSRYRFPFFLIHAISFLLFGISVSKAACSAISFKDSTDSELPRE